MFPGVRGRRSHRWPIVVWLHLWAQDPRLGPCQKFIQILQLLGGRLDDLGMFQVQMLDDELGALEELGTVCTAILVVVHLDDVWLEESLLIGRRKSGLCAVVDHGLDDVQSFSNAEPLSLIAGCDSRRGSE